MVGARSRGDHALAEELERDYVYAGEQTCAVDGMCITACPVLINTGDLVRRLRRQSTSRPAETAWAVAARGWGGAALLGSAGLSIARILPSGLPTAVTALGRRVVGADTVPLYDAGLPAGGGRRVEQHDLAPEAVVFGACVGQLFGAEADGQGAGDALLQLCRRAQVQVRTPEGLGGLCCGTPWKSKGFTQGYDAMAAKVVPALRAATDGGRLPVVVDASSCAEGLVEMLTTRAPELRVLDAVEFVADRVLPRLRLTHPVDSVVVHPTCSTHRAGTTEAMVRLAGAVGTDVIVPTSWGCCAFAGDRGMLHPELTASATRREAEEVATADATTYVSSNRTCEIGMTRATGRPYVHVLEALVRATR